MNFITVWKAWRYNLYNMKYQKHKKEKHKHYINDIAIDTIYPNCWTGYSSPSCYSVWSCLSMVPCFQHSLQLCISLTSDIHTCLCEVVVHSPLFFGIPWILSLSTFNSRPPHLTSCPTKIDFCIFSKVIYLHQMSLRMCRFDLFSFQFTLYSTSCKNTTSCISHFI